MRNIGEIQNSDTAKRFSYLAQAHGYTCEIEGQPDSTYTVWGIDEDQLDATEQLLNEFLANPDREDFVQDIKRGETLHHKVTLQQKKRELTGQLQRSGFQSSSAGYVTKTLIAISIVVYILMQLPATKSIYYSFLISLISPEQTGSWLTALYPVRQGQVWRLVTPIFLHFGLMHIIFNMYWLFILGRVIEARKGSLFMLVFVVFTAIPSNLIQFIIYGPAFGGMSGVVYGLLGYIWIKGRVAPQEGFYIEPTFALIMLVWLVLGFLGFMHMANAVHLVGLIVGVLWGYTSSVYNR